MSEIPIGHPRYVSLHLRDAIVAGMEAGITSIHGLVAHGRGEAYDYLLGERSRRFATRAVHAAAALLLRAERPVISVNGNVAALVPAEIVGLAETLDAPLEVNLFHGSKRRERLIRHHLEAHGAARVLTPSERAELPFIASHRRFVHPEGIFRADAVFVPLEDGDRCRALRRMGREVVTVDLNPLSRTARAASVTVVDNVVRALPLLLQHLHSLSNRPISVLDRIISAYDNRAILHEAEARIRKLT